MKTLGRIFGWIDAHLLFWWACFLIIFIPLYPKIPIWSPIEQYIVRVRLEDFFIFGAALCWFVQVIRRKIVWKTGFFWWVLAYAVVGFASTLSAMYVTKTVPLEPLHIGKTILHYFRYLEYFSLFFIAFSSVKTRKQVKIMLAILALTVFGIVVYGYGQKYFYWPVYSTMNREFSKGIRLYLTEFARVQSTFAGHYDMAAYMVVVLPMLLASALHATAKWAKRGFWITFWLGSWLLILSASRMPFASYLGGIGMVVLISAWLKNTWKEKVTFALQKGTLTLVGVAILFYYFGADLSERLGHVINANPQLSQGVKTLTEWRRMVISDEQVSMLPLSPKQLQAILPKTKPPLSGISTDQLAAQVAQEVAATQEVASSKDQPPTPVGTPNPQVAVPPIFKAPAATQLPAGVYVDVPDEVQVSTVSAGGQKTTTTVKRPRVYSECALKKELSLCIRLETLWPRAIEGFLYNPVLGTGYATLTKEGIEVFTEADSTDNNYLRTLGETGGLGFIVFYGSIIYLLVKSFKRIKDEDWLIRTLTVGFIGGSIGLLLNAIYIDVFAASKVAQTYWTVSGVVIAALTVVKKRQSGQEATSPESIPVTRPTQRTKSTKTKSARANRSSS